ncbi:MAG: response regulator [Acidobacteria bacterium]|nr:response regulator [Acidobacteriota bacterium]
MNSETHRIFVVDDEPEQLEKLSTLFSQDFSVNDFLDGDSCLEALEKDQSDACKATLIDLNLAGQQFTGAELCREVKKRKPYLPVFAITASPDTEYIADALLNYGFEDYIPKLTLWDYPQKYALSVTKAIQKYESYPGMVLLWRRLSTVKPEEFRLSVNSELVDELSYRLRKAYFYLLLPESQPLLDSLLLEENASCGESLVQSASAIEAILIHQDKQWKEDMINQAKNKMALSGMVTTVRRKSLDRIIKAGWIDKTLKNGVLKLFGWRDDCAHAGKRARLYHKEDALEGLGIALDVIEYFLNRRKQEVMGN